MNLPEKEQLEKTFQFPYRGWDSVEQLEDVIGEEESCNLLFPSFGDDDEEELELQNVHYDLEITIRRVKRSDYKR